MRITRFESREHGRFEVNDNGKLFVGARSLTVIGSLALPTIENANAMRLPEGIYEAEFAMWTARSGKRAKAIRFLLSWDQFQVVYGDRVREMVKKHGEHRARGRFYHHPANTPRELDGCFASGLEETAGGVGHAVAASNLIFKALGGWVEGKRIEGGIEVGR